MSNTLNKFDAHISDRIKELVKHIPNDAAIADIGCDHGYLIYEAFKEGKIKKALAVDNKIGPLSSAFFHLPANSHLMYSLSSGLDDVDESIDTVVMAGMGGHLIGDLLLEHPEKILGKHFILSPQHKAAECRRVFNDLHIAIIDENVYEFENKIYTIIDAVGVDYNIDYSPLEIEMGPYLLKKRPELWLSQLKHEYKWLSQIKDISSHPQEEQRLKDISHVLMLA